MHSKSNSSASDLSSDSDILNPSESESGPPDEGSEYHGSLSQSEVSNQSSDGRLKVCIWPMHHSYDVLLSKPHVLAPEESIDPEQKDL